MLLCSRLLLTASYYNIFSGCNYSTKILVDCFTDHCIEEHAWGIYPCSSKNCNFESYSETCFKQHVKSHVYFEQKGKDLTETCDRKNCGMKFSRYCQLLEHLKVHDNIVIRSGWTSSEILFVVEIYRV